MGVDVRMRVCPWCRSGEAERGIRSVQSQFWAGHYHWFGECECGARGPYAENEEEALRVWNDYPLWKNCAVLELLKLEVVLQLHTREAFEIIEELQRRAAAPQFHK